MLVMYPDWPIRNGYSFCFLFMRIESVVNEPIYERCLTNISKSDQDQLRLVEATRPAACLDIVFETKRTLDCLGKAIEDFFLLQQ